MKHIFSKPLQILVIISFFALFTACGGITQYSRNKQIREKLILAYQYLENMEYDSALDAFAAVIEIDMKQTDAYIGMSRAYSALGRQDEAGKTARDGFEATGSDTLQSLGRMYDRITDHKDDLKKIAELLREGEEKIPSELEEKESGLFSDTLDKVWESLDESELYDYSSDVLIYLIEPEKGICLLLYPDGHFYFGEVNYTPYSEILAMEEDLEQENDGNDTVHESELAIPAREGYGIWAGIDREGKIADFYAGMWKNVLPEDSDGFYACQDLTSGSRFVFYGTFERGAFGTASALYGSSDAFLERAMGIVDGTQESEKAVFLSVVNPFGRGMEAVMIPAPNTGTLYDPDFENREFFERLDNGENPDIILYSKTEFHGLSLVNQDKVSYIIDAEGNTLFCGYEYYTFFDTKGFWGLVPLAPGEDYVPEKYVDAEWMNHVEIGYKAMIINYDWEGNVINIETDTSPIVLTELPYYVDGVGWTFTYGVLR